MAAALDRRAGRSSSLLLVIDIQERLLPAIDGHESLLKQAEKMVRAAGILGVPVLCTEQYPKGLGPTVEPLRSLLGSDRILEKITFSCCGGAGVIAALASAARPQVVLVGIEAHVCVQQTGLDLLAAGYQVYVVADAVSSRRATDRQVALERLRQAGAVVTTAEAVMFEWLERAGTAEFKEVSKLVKE